MASMASWRRKKKMAKKAKKINAMKMKYSGNEIIKPSVKASNGG
jgi:hypothetical protein